jgi:hypothetical protein
MKKIITYALWLPARKQFGFFAGLEGEGIGHWWRYASEWVDVNSSVLHHDETPTSAQELRAWAKLRGRTVKKKNMGLWVVSAPQ